jgi:type I restriction enzyme R subunit
VITRGQKPEDYLDSFCRFVRENPEQIDAITILLERPREWKTEVLNELREKLVRNQFREQELQRAHQVMHDKALADIISMVKRAARAEEPIYTAAERVDRAMQVGDGWQVV